MRADSPILGAAFRLWAWWAVGSLVVWVVLWLNTEPDYFNLRPGIALGHVVACALALPVVGLLFAHARRGSVKAQDWLVAAKMMGLVAQLPSLVFALNYGDAAFAMWAIDVSVDLVVTSALLAEAFIAGRRSPA